MKSVNDVSAHLLTMSPVRAVPRSRRKRQRHRRPMALFRGGKLLIAFRGAEGPDALQVIGEPLTTPLAAGRSGGLRSLAAAVFGIDKRDAQDQFLGNPNSS